MKDLARILVRAGKGGDGSVHFRHEKFAPKGGPDGGDGGKGGDVILVGDENVESLVEFNYQKHFEAKDGEQGYGKKMHGKDMPDIKIRLPIGTVVWEIPAEMAELDLRVRENLEQVLRARRLVADMVEHNTECVIAYGGKGGRGNWHFRSSSNQVPMEREEGRPGEKKWILLEQKVVADIGIVGLPNAGKSSLLKALTRANPKIAGYPFTTLEPNLGVMTTTAEQKMILVDVPGVVEEAWEGKGIGPWFLRHLERTKLLLHVLAPCVEKAGMSAEEIAASLCQDFEVVRLELAKYAEQGSALVGSEITAKPEIIVVNKRELIDEEWWSEIATVVAKVTKREVVLVSAAMGEGLGELRAQIEKTLQGAEAA